MPEIVEDPSSSGRVPIHAARDALVSRQASGLHLAHTSHGVDDFIRRYDGEGNPVGVGHTVAGWRNLLLAAGFKIRGHEIHFFPRRFVPFGHRIPRSAHLLLNRLLGTMVYFDLEKP